MVRAMLPLPVVSLRPAACRWQLPVDHAGAGFPWSRHGRADVLLLDGTAPSAARAASARVHVQTARRRAGGRLSLLHGHGAVRARAPPGGGVSICRYSPDLLQLALHPRPLS